MVLRSMLYQSRGGIDELVNLDAIVERLKRLRAMNRPSDSIGITQYRWRSFSIDKPRIR